MSYDFAPQAEESMTEWFCQGCRCQGPSNISCISYQIVDKMSIILSLNTVLKYTCSIFCPLYTNIQIHFRLLSKCSECSDLKEMWVWKILEAVYCVARRGCSSTCPVPVARMLTAAAFNAWFTTAALSFLNQWWRGLVTSWIIFSVLPSHGLAMSGALAVLCQNGVWFKSYCRWFARSNCYCRAILSFLQQPK